MVQPLDSDDKKKWDKLNKMKSQKLDELVSSFNEGGEVKLNDKIRNMAEIIFNEAIKLSASRAEAIVEAQQEGRKKKFTAKARARMVEMYAQQHFEESLPDIVQALKERTRKSETLKETPEELNSNMKYFNRSLRNFFHKKTAFGAESRDYRPQVGDDGDYTAAGSKDDSKNYGKRLFNFFTKKGSGVDAEPIARKTSPLAFLFARGKKINEMSNNPEAGARKLAKKDLDKFNSLGGGGGDEKGKPRDPHKNKIDPDGEEKSTQRKVAIWKRAIGIVLWPFRKTLALGRGAVGLATGGASMLAKAVKFLRNSAVVAVLAKAALAAFLSPEIMDYIKQNIPTLETVEEFMKTAWEKMKDWGGEGLEWAWEKLKSMLGVGWDYVSEFFKNKVNPAAQRVVNNAAEKAQAKPDATVGLARNPTLMAANSMAMARNPDMVAKGIEKGSNSLKRGNVTAGNSVIDKTEYPTIIGKAKTTMDATKPFPAMNEKQNNIYYPNQATGNTKVAPETKAFGTPKSLFDVSSPKEMTDLDAFKNHKGYKGNMAGKPAEQETANDKIARNATNLYHPSQPSGTSLTDIPKQVGSPELQVYNLKMLH